jgi:hypothetical protein
MTMRAGFRFRLLLPAGLFALVLASVATAASVEKSLLASDGTLYIVHAGTAADLGVAGAGIAPSDFIIEWVARRQDGSRVMGIIPGTANPNAKRDLDMTYDEENRALVLLWSEHFSFLNQIHLAILRNGSWETVALAPNLGLARAYNPRMLLSHHVARYEVEGGQEVTANRSLLSIIFWEEGSKAQARYAPIFLDEDLDDQELQVYDLPALVESDSAAGAAASWAGHAFPTLQTEGLAGTVLASFSDLGRQKQFVVKITFPENLGRPGSGNLTWLRRRIPVVGVMGEAPLAAIPEMQDLSVSTVIGAGYKPTHFWQDRDAVKYLRYSGREWASVRAIPLNEDMSYERAVRLIEEMARRN